MRGPRGPGFKKSDETSRPRSALSTEQRRSLLEKLQECDRVAEAAGASQDQKQLLLQLEQGLHLRRRLHPESSDEVSAACRRLCQACNFAATVRLQQADLRGAQELLKRAEQVSDKSDKDRALTWNNMACYYRRTNKLRSAAKFLERALALEEHTGSAADAAQTQLNLCATLSQLKQHGEALRHAQSALISHYELLMPQILNGELSAAGTIPKSATEQFTVLCIAYHNVAVENEYLQNLGAAACAYAEGYRWAVKFLGQSHQLASILRHAAESVKGKLPSGSGCVARVEEIMAGWPQAAAQASLGGCSGLGGTSGFGNLLTPRHDDDQQRSSKAQSRGSPSMISEVKVPNASKSPASEGGDSEDASYNDHFDERSKDSSSFQGQLVVQK
eukprot:TRINITY_DN90673_c0_g1_i1.p1 TRINITY_DN90673_c0_g1~~TRINITY_DN90673_c0_g1_i1.p1  ORF type:complete len:389 (+),score=98.60 TRINITY_DN90673_c0_g1_i1:58-1224(+)